MTQKLNNNELRQLYFDNVTPSKSFRKRENHIKASGLKQSFFDTSTNYKRFDEKEIKRFENLFNNYVNVTAQDYIFKEPEVISKTPTPFENESAYATPEPRETNVQSETGKRKTVALELSQLEKDLIKQVKLDDEPVVSSESVVPTENNVLTENVDVKDDDLLYLEALVSSGTVAQESHSLSDLLAEIVDNEKAPISNYEPSVFNANVQMLFEEDELASPTLPVAPTEELEVPNAPTFDLNLPPLPETAKLVQERAVGRDSHSETIELPENVMPKFAEASIEEMLEADDETFVEASVEEFVPEKRKRRKKNAKLSILDTILVLIILAIMSVLAYSQRHLLPFDLPF